MGRYGSSWVCVKWGQTRTKRPWWTHKGQSSPGLYLRHQKPLPHQFLTYQDLYVSLPLFPSSSYLCPVICRDPWIIPFTGGRQSNLSLSPCPSILPDATRGLWPSRCRTCTCPRPRSAPVGRPPPAPRSVSTGTCQRSCEEAPPPSRMPTSSGRQTASARPRWVSSLEDLPTLSSWAPSLIYLTKTNRPEMNRKVGIK